MQATQQLHDLGQSLWLDNISRAELESGTLERYRDQYAITGLTSNPTILDRAIGDTSDYDAAIHDGLAAGRSGEALLFDLALADLRRAAELFRPVHERTDGVDGWVSLELSPRLVDDAAGSARQARRLHEDADCPNLFVKIPGTPQGLRAIEETILAGVPVNVTLLFSREQYLAAAAAYARGIERRIAQGLNPRVASVASIFVSRWDRAVADRVPAELRDRLGIAVAGQAYAAYRELLSSDRWLRLFNAGARPQRLLWASTSTKDPQASDVLYVRALAAPLTVNTMPDKTLLAFADHGTLEGQLPPDGGDSGAVLAEFRRAGIEPDTLATELQQEGAEAFAQSWEDLLRHLSRKRTALAQR
jgi:transaldolase